MSKDVWVIGGTSGIGRSVAAMLNGRGDEAIATGTEVDVRDRRAMDDFYRKAGPFDAVVYSAGINRLMWTAMIDDVAAADILNTNTVGFMRLLRTITDSECRSVVAISSDAATRPMRTSMAYCASKAALDMCVRCAARELAPHVRVNAVSPGMTDYTEMTRYIDMMVPQIRGWSVEKAAEYERSQIPMARRATPEEIARVVLSVLDGPEYLTGSIITVNGGR